MRQFYLLFFLVPIMIFGQDFPAVDFVSGDVSITPDTIEKSIKGSVSYAFEMSANTDSIFLDAIDMGFQKVALNGKEVPYSNNGKQIAFQAPKNMGEHLLTLWFTSKPKQTVYFFGWDDQINGNEQIWTQGQGKYTSHWLPSFDDMSEKIEFDFQIMAPKEYDAIANGELLEVVDKDSLNAWRFNMEKPMSSYLAAFAIGDFDKKTLKSASGVPIELYYEPKDSLKVEPTFRYMKEIFDFLEEEIEVPYPWQNYKQVPAQDFLYAGMENTTLTIFSNTYVIDSMAFIDKNYVNVNAHELAHQWFGNLVTEKSGEHHWLHEGFATYYAYLTEKELFGDDHYYWRLYDTAKTLNILSENGDGEALTNPNANSLTFYEKGAWALVMLREIAGEEAFKKGIRNYLEKFAFKNVTIADFLSEVESASGKDLTGFRKEWLEGEEFPWESTKAYLVRHANSIKEYFELKKADGATIKKMDWYSGTTSAALKRQLILTYGLKTPVKGLESILQKEKDLKTRQAVAQVIESVPQELKEVFASLLEDESYVTQELALFKLWTSFPSERENFLSQTNNVMGLPNKNIRLLWLTLALVTPEIHPEKKKGYYEELNGYTAPNHHFEVRQLAFEYLNHINALNNEALANLVEAADHHVWQFKKFSRNLLRELMTDELFEKRLNTVYETLTKENKKILDKLNNK
ncbi:M1 family metallopeptidase [Allomuricauda sp. SCSIO 65647]|uniref:M1 family metallopeptidase n=1 Tax=Allomuricauda sp. SCSIO 65647 TaxID=2908843 RepID=UPI001F385D39|nr:M1 family metallopeptidase [Muricauda sp. SCSIO 65647]UJH67465.1 M1 family metallopeptidase [Muricauda sp. SCSIO 65647]